MNKSRILLVDDEPDSCKALSLLLQKTGYNVDFYHTGDEALAHIKLQKYDLVISDLLLPDISGIEILKQAKELSPNTSVILITGNASAETAVEAMKEGALDYITKPFNIERLKIQVAKALEKSRLVLENQFLRQQLRVRYQFTNIIGTSQAMQQVFRRMEKVVATDSTILILGASGTGKELVAKAIHFNGPRKDKPFIAINCGAIPGELLESELFGHTKGAFTSAIADKPGKFEVANGGSIFLDEIGDMPLQLQMKLLRVLQEQEIERVGSSKKIKLNVRLISATNVNLMEQVKQGSFREDLYYRLNVIPIQLPPLKERRGDIPQLARYFMEKTCKEMKRKATIGPEAMQAMENYDWPGNVREMENIIERVVALTDSDVIKCSDMPADIAQSSQPEEKTTSLQLTNQGLNLAKLIAELEREMISQALELGNGVKARAANLLGLNRTTLVEKMKRLGLDL